MMSLRNCAMTSGAILLTVLLLFGCGGGGGGSDASVPPAAPQDNTLVSIDLGVTKTVASQTVPESGADIIVDAPEDPLDGLQIHVLDGSYEDPKDFTLTSTPITGYSGNPHFNPVTPLITVQNGGEYSTRAMALKIPVTVEEGFHYMAFFFDENTGRLEGIPELTHDENSLTVATRHFSQIVVNKMEITKELAQGTFESGYSVGKDNWNFVNHGSYLSPGGICSGMSQTSLYYYAMEKGILGGADLYGRFLGENENDWRDDAKGIKFASMAQVWHKTSTDDAFIAWDGINRNQTTHAWSYFMFIHALKVTEQPQFIGVLPAEDGVSGHALVVYKKEGDSLFLADPNSPTDATAKMEFIWLGDDPVKIPLGDWIPYIGSWNVNSAPKAYTRVYYYGQTALMDWDEMARLFETVEDGSVGNGVFPEYTLTLTDEDEDGVEFFVPLTGSYVAQNDWINISVDANGFNPYITVISEDGSVETAHGEGVDVRLISGISRIGVYVTDESNGRWVDFKYFDISYDIKTCEEGEELINDICVPIGCNLVCTDPVVSDTLTLSSHDGSYSIDIEFYLTHKMCAQTIIDSASISGKITMLYFYKSGGTDGPYSEPYSSTWQMGDTGKVLTGSEPLKVISSGLPYPNSSTKENLLAWHSFGFVAGNYSTISQYNDRDYIWFDYANATPPSSPTVVNTETVDKYGCYTGQY